MYIYCEFSFTKLRQKINIFQTQNKQLIDQHGHFKCPFPGCKQTNQFNGKHKQEQEHLLYVQLRISDDY